jgi:MBG domain (YGX type)/Bacterial Ig-like domain (group 3)/Cadherin-like domain
MSDWELHPIVFQKCSCHKVKHCMKQNHNTYMVGRKTNLSMDTPVSSLWRLVRNLLFSLVLPASAFLGSASLMDAAALTVINANDSGAGSLRQAILAAGVGDTITFDPSLSGQTITLTTGELVVSTNLTIAGPGSALLTVSGNGISRVFHFTGGTSTISGLTVANGYLAGGNGVTGDGGGGGGGAMGAGLLADWSSTVYICNMAFEYNSVFGGHGGGNGGGGGSENGSAGGAGKGGSSGTLALPGYGLGGTSGGAAGANQAGGGGGSGSGVGAAYGGGNGSFGGGGGGGGGNGGFGPGAPGGTGGISLGFGGSGGAGANTDVGGSGGGGAGLGGAVCVWQEASVTFSNVSFTGNTAYGGSGGAGAQNGVGKGAAIFVCPGGVAAEGDVSFDGNVSENGGNDAFYNSAQVLDTPDAYGAFQPLNYTAFFSDVIYADASIWVSDYGNFFTNDTQSVPGEVVDWVANGDPNGALDATALQFNLTSLNGTVLAALLQVHICQSFGTPYLSVYGSLDNSWSELGSTNLPATLDSQTTADYTQGFAAGDWAYINVTGFVNSVLAGSKIASFELTNEVSGMDYDTGDGFVMDSYQSIIPELRPALLIIQPTPVLVSTALTIDSSTNPSAAGDSVTFTATVNPASGSTAPTGLVNFIEDGTLLGSVSLAASGFNATATFTATNLAVGDDIIIAEYGGDSNFTGSTNTVLQLVNLAAQAPLVFTLAASADYGSTNALSVGGGSGLGAVSYTVLSGPGEIVDGSNLLITAGIGAVVVEVTRAAYGDYAEATTNAILLAIPAPLTITANNQTTVFGAGLPALTASYAGFANGDTPLSLSTPPTLATTATPLSRVSGNPYAITASGAVDYNYAIIYVPGALTVTPAALTVTANNITTTYGAALPTLTASFSGFVNGNTAQSLTTQPTLATIATSQSHVGGNPYSITASGAVDADYTISYVNGLLTVAPAPLIITADNQTKVYGAALPTLTASYTGFVNGDNPGTLITQPILSTTANAGSSVGIYAITAGGAGDADYTISYVNGTLSVTAVLLTVTANGATRPYGTTNPVFTGTIVGLVDGDSITASYTSDATTNSPAGMYQIIPTLDDPLNLAANYNVFLFDAELNVVAAIILTSSPIEYAVGDAPIILDTNAMVNDGGSINYAGALLTVTVVTNAFPDDQLALISSGTNAGQIEVQGAAVSYGGVPLATLSLTSNSLDFAFGTNNVTSGMLTVLLRQVTFATDDTSTNFEVVQVALDYGSNSVVASRVILLVSPPVVNDVVIVATKGVEVSILISDLLTNATDTDGYAITLASVNSISTDGGIITTNQTTLTYTPPNNLVGNQDSFEVLYSDSHGGETVGLVTLEFLPPNQIQIDATNILTTGVQLTLAGTPGQVYQIQVSTDLLNWVFLETVRASPTGIIGVLDAVAKDFPYRFYRAVLRPPS